MWKIAKEDESHIQATKFCDKYKIAQHQKRRHERKILNVAINDKIKIKINACITLQKSRKGHKGTCSNVKP